MDDQEQAVQRLNEQLAQWRSVGQAEYAQMLGISEEELLAFIPQGLPYHAHPSSSYGEYRFHVSRVEEDRLRIECIRRGYHEYEFNRYYDARQWPVMKCQHCGAEEYRKEPFAPEGAAPTPALADNSGPATPKQIDYLKLLNAWYAPDITKAAASVLIERAKLNRKVVSPILYVVKPIRAVCGACGAERHVTEMVAAAGGYDWDNPDPDFQGSVGLLSYRCADGVGCRQKRRDSAEFARLDAEAADAGRYDDNSPGKVGV